MVAWKQNKKKIEFQFSTNKILNYENKKKKKKNNNNQGLSEPISQIGDLVVKSK